MIVQNISNFLLHLSKIIYISISTHFWSFSIFYFRDWSKKFKKRVVSKLWYSRLLQDEPGKYKIPEPSPITIKPKATNVAKNYSNYKRGEEISGYNDSIKIHSKKSQGYYDKFFK